MIGTLKNKKTINIVGYDLDLGRYDCEDNITRTTDEFLYFYVSSDEMKEFVLRTDTVVDSYPEVISIEDLSSDKKDKKKIY